MFGLDIDGVLYPWHTHVHDWAVNDFGLTLSYDEFWQWPGGWMYNNRESLIMANVVNNPLLYNKSLIRPEIHEAVWKIKELVGNVCYITGRPAGVQFDTKLWLERSELPDIDKLFFTPAQYGAKLSLVKQLGCEFFVDDRLDYIEELLGATRLFLVTQLWNEDYENEDVTRVSDVADVVEYLE
jgi:uncharacterized HAD superfamily protein